jgi:hypothetical protein
VGAHLGVHEGMKGNQALLGPFFPEAPVVSPKFTLRSYAHVYLVCQIWWLFLICKLRHVGS